MHNTCNCGSHSCEALSQWSSSIQRTNSQGIEAVIDGHSLDIAILVAVARYGVQARLHEKTSHHIAESAKYLQSSLEQGDTIYGVNTGFGGSADTRTEKTEELQATVIRELHCGILSNPTQGGQSTSNVLPCEDACSNTCMPEAWARASILVRVNSLASGHSGVRPILISNMLELLRKDIIPRIPLRGSISASGDLMPLSYIGGTLEGKRGLTVWAGSRPDRRIVTADVALAESSLDPIKLGPKEGLAIINGTAVSAGVAALVIHDANNIAVLSQLLTAMSVEALRGTDESFDSFFAAVRPHPGQIDAARNIRNFLTGSELVQRNHGSEAGNLRQDRYPIRTAAQWLGPVLEDLRLASQQIVIECNSVTDNPLIDTEVNPTGNVRILHGGNFQAKAITSAMEKVRLAVQTIGQMLFAQCTEIINPRLNYGLPPNLVFDEPSQSFLLKPVDIMIAALQSELGFLSNPVGTHVQSAEMGNQALNSLGLISARYTHIALDVLSQLAAAHLFTLCQALDLRAMHCRFLRAVEATLRTITSDTLAEILGESAFDTKTSEVSPYPQQLERSRADLGFEDQPQGQDEVEQNDEHPDFTPISTLPSHTPLQKQPGQSDSGLRTSAHLLLPNHSSSDIRLENLHSSLWKDFIKMLDQTTTIDSAQRFATIFVSLQSTIVGHISQSSSKTVPAIKSWTQQCSTSALELFLRNRDSYHACPDASLLLGKASGHMYNFVRKELGVPFLRASMMTHDGGCLGNGSLDRNGGSSMVDEGDASVDGPEPGLTTGELITTIYQSIRTGALYSPVMECLGQVEHTS